MTPADDTLQVEQRDQIAVVTLNRPDKANTLTPDLADRMATVMRDLGTSGVVGAIVVTGAGRAFCGGFDLGRVNRGVDDGPVTRLMASVRSSTVPTIAALNGPAVGAGLELACSCDLRLASRGARIGLPAVRIGVAYRLDGLDRVLRAVGRPAVEMLLSGSLITADESPGFARMLDADELLPRAREVATQIAAASWTAVSYTTRALRLLDEAATSRIDVGSFEKERIAIMHGPDIAEAAAARSEGRPPRFARSTP